LQYKPMVRFIWLGAVIIALGGLIAICDRRYRQRVGAEATSPAQAGTSAA
jgi:cytochrome c-type biogenesis protein CcmF